jgi:large subunit ribosomal protein L25
VQWDTFGGIVLHLDFYRVSAGELVETTLTVALRGEAPGVKAGGVVEQVQHELEIECPVSSLPDRLELSIRNLELGAAIHARDVPMPEGARLLSDPDAVIVHCVMPMRDEEEAPAAPAEAGEPEVIGRKAGEEEEEGEE